MANPLRLFPGADLSISSPLRPHCAPCVLAKPGNFARSDGQGWSGVMVLLEALGETEAETHIPLTGPSGELYDRLVARTPHSPALDRDFAWIVNSVNCRPPENKLRGKPWEKEALTRCRPYLEEAIDIFKPKAIFALGGIALEAALPPQTSPPTLNRWRGYVTPSKWGIPLVSSYHPAFLMRGNMGMSWLWIRDLQKVLKVARGEWKVAPCSYILFPTPEEFRAWGEKYLALPSSPPLSLDIETPYSASLDEDDTPLEDSASYQIERISFSYEENTAITVPYLPQYLGMVSRLLASPGRKVTFNGWAFDIPRLRAKGHEVNGPVDDVMYMWKLWQPQARKSLAQVAATLTDLPPWKHLANENPEFYSCVDADAPLRAFNRLWAVLQDIGMLPTYERHYVRLVPALTRMAARGVPTNRALRKTTLERLKTEFGEHVQWLTRNAPKSILGVHPKKGFKKTEEQLRKSGSWVEGQMRLIDVEISQEEFDKLKAKEEAKHAKLEAKRVARENREKAKLERARQKAERGTRQARRSPRRGRGSLLGDEDGAERHTGSPAEGSRG